MFQRIDVARAFRDPVYFPIKLFQTDSKKESSNDKQSFRESGSLRRLGGWGLGAQRDG
jgi:hypothetical protein